MAQEVEVVPYTPKRFVIIDLAKSNEKKDLVYELSIQYPEGIQEKRPGAFYLQHYKWQNLVQTHCNQRIDRFVWKGVEFHIVFKE